MLTPQQAQDFLASKLQYKPFYSDFLAHAGEPVRLFKWNNGDIIRDSEWDYIARQVEGKLSEEQMIGYEYELYRRSFKGSAGMSSYILWLIKLDYITRATALKEIMQENSK